MDYQAIFERYEIKYILSALQKRWLLQRMNAYMALDAYGRTTIRNIYFDTSSFRLARHSMEHPAYKEKLRLRSYCQATPEKPVFVEIKKKYQSVVYKRRLSLPTLEAMNWLCCGETPALHTQIAEEIEYFRSYYSDLRPAAFLSYEREAYVSLNGGDFRVTLDDHILARDREVSLLSDVWGTPLLGRDQVLMEIKTSGGIPLWMTHFLTEQRLYKTSFSKYATAYRNVFRAGEKGRYTHV